MGIYPRHVSDFSRKFYLRQFDVSQKSKLRLELFRIHSKIWYVDSRTNSEFRSRSFEYGTVCRNPFCRIRPSVPALPILPNFFRQSGHQNLAKWAKQLSTSANRLFESENIMWGISDVCTLALTVEKTSSHYDRFAISVPGRSLLLFDFA